MESIIVSRESENEKEIKIGFTHQLRVLELCASRLLSFYRFKQLEGVSPPTPFFNKKIVFPKLEVLDLKWMKIEKIWDDHLAITAEETCWFQNLTTLKVSGCDNLSYLFTFSMVKSFARLNNFEIKYCKSIEEIIATNKGEIEEERLLLFPKLECLVLVGLPKLKFLCHGNLFKCQSLENLRIKKCPLLNVFMGTNDSTPDLGSTTLFDEKVVLPKLEELSLKKIKNEKIWDDESAISAGRSCGLQNLTSLKVDKCDNLSYLFTSSMVKSFTKLKQLQVHNCKSIEKIVASMEREMAGEIQLSFPKLDYLKLKDLPKLKRFCHASLLECQLLRELLIEDCFELKTFISANDSSPDNSTILFSEKVAFPNMEELKISGAGNFKMICGNQLHPNSFSRLKKLDIAGCESLEKVFDIQILAMNEKETCRILPFQNLRGVMVSECPTLTSIFPTSLVSTLLQQLERLEVRDCDKIDLFGFNNTQQLNDAIAKVISSLKYCYLERGGMIVKYEHQRFKLKIVECGFQVCPILFALLKSFPKLDKVVVSSCSIIQLFPCDLAADDDMDTQAKTLARIQTLSLEYLSHMKHIWSEHASLKYHGIPGDLKVLEVVYCDSLLSLAPPSTTLFKNLTGLVVSRCPMLIKLVTSSSTAKSLVNLKEMSVTKCDSLEEIVVVDDQSDELISNVEFIDFEKLEVLNLQDLNSLTSFCSTSYCDFRFPSLNWVIIKNCPEMKFFSKGVLSTPKLIMVWPFWVNEEYEERKENQMVWPFWVNEEYEERKENQPPHSRWEGDLNSTIPQLVKKNQAPWEKVVVKLDVHDDKERQKAMKAASNILGIDSLLVDMKDGKLTAIGDIDPVDVVNKLKKWQAKIVTVGLGKEEKKEPAKNEDDNKKKEILV